MQIGMNIFWYKDWCKNKRILTLREYDSGNNKGNGIDKLWHQYMK